MRARTLSCLALAFLVGSAAAVRAQTPFHKGINLLGPSVSLSTYGSTIALGGHYEHGIKDHIGVGAAVEWFKYNCGGGFSDCSVTYISLAGTVAYHFDVHNEKVDLSAGGALGYNVISCGSEFGDFCKSSSILIGGYGKARYFVKPKIALNAAVGYGLGFLSVGVDFVF